MILTGKGRSRLTRSVIGEEPVPVRLCPPQIPPLCVCVCVCARVRVHVWTLSSSLYAASWGSGCKSWPPDSEGSYE